MTRWLGVGAIVLLGCAYAWPMDHLSARTQDVETGALPEASDWTSKLSLFAP